ncbi:MAG: hypothetical protein VYC34_09385, partial [Planctomycetota bacterium]|nr:hypothetical protein [Planctomycetota bacterium]
QAATGRIEVFLSRGGGDFDASVMIDLPTICDASTIASIISSDFNADAFPDIATIDQSAAVAVVLLNLGVDAQSDWLAFDLPEALPAGGAPAAIAAAPIFSPPAKPAPLDLVVADQSQGLLTAFRNLGGAFDRGLEIQVPAAPVFVVAADLDGDNRPDLLTPGASTSRGVTQRTLNVRLRTAPAPCPDLTSDGVTDSADLAALLTRWGPVGPEEPADFDRNGFVTATDLAALLGAWGPCAR